METLFFHSVFVSFQIASWVYSEYSGITDFGCGSSGIREMRRAAFVTSIPLRGRKIRQSQTVSHQQQQQPSRESRVAGNAAKWARLSARGPPMMASVTNTTATIMDGKSTAAAIRREVSIQVEKRKQDGKSIPGLAVIIVGNRPDSATYVRGKRKACTEVGFNSYLTELEENCTQEEIEKEIEKLNNEKHVHGILVQLPIPKHLDEEKVLSKINLAKDVDGFHPLNIGRLCMSGRTPPNAIPCTPKGCIELLDRYGVTIEGKEVVVIGRSNIVGLPLAMLLLHRNATVTICHSRTKNIEEKVKNAEILIAACGIPEFVKGDWLKDDVVIVDVGINAVDDSTKKKGYRLVGDVEKVGAEAKASLRTPVPGGVGPMTIAMLMKNTLELCERADDVGDEITT